MIQIFKKYLWFFRTDTLLEIFEDAPDDNANWGEIVDTEKKFYDTSTGMDILHSEYVLLDSGSFLNLATKLVPMSYLII